jgi:hypothetical protein
MSKRKLKVEPKLVQCLSCKKKRPPVITGAAFLIYVRKGHYDHKAGTVEVDKRLMGVCEACMGDKTEFQRDINRRFAVDPNNPDLVYRSV